MHSRFFLIVFLSLSVFQTITSKPFDEIQDEAQVKPNKIDNSEVLEVVKRKENDTSSKSEIKLNNQITTTVPSISSSQNQTNNLPSTAKPMDATDSQNNSAKVTEDTKTIIEPIINSNNSQKSTKTMNSLDTNAAQISKNSSSEPMTVTEAMLNLTEAASEATTQIGTKIQINSNATSPSLGNVTASLTSTKALETANEEIVSKTNPTTTTTDTTTPTSTTTTSSTTTTTSSTTTTTSSTTTTSTSTKETLIKDELYDDKLKESEVDKVNQIEDTIKTRPRFSTSKPYNKIQMKNNINYFDEEEQTSSWGFFTYFLLLSTLCVVVYIAYHNKNRIIALVLEGKRSTGHRRMNNNVYNRLENLNDVMPNSN